MIPPKCARFVYALNCVFLALFGEELEVVDSLKDFDCMCNAFRIAHIVEMYIATLEHVGFVWRDDVAIEPCFCAKARVEAAWRNVQRHNADMWQKVFVELSAQCFEAFGRVG